MENLYRLSILELLTNYNEAIIKVLTDMNNHRYTNEEGLCIIVRLYDNFNLILGVYTEDLNKMELTNSINNSQKSISDLIDRLSSQCDPVLTYQKSMEIAEVQYGS